MIMSGEAIIISTMSYCFRLIRDSYLEMALLFLHMREPKSKLSVSPLTLKVINYFIKNFKLIAFEFVILATVCY